MVAEGCEIEGEVDFSENVTVDENARVGKRPEEMENLNDWGVSVVGMGVNIGKGATVEPKAMIGEDVKEA